MGQDQDLCNKLAVDFWRRVEFGEDDHALADLLPSHTLESEGGRLSGLADGNGDALSLYRPDASCRELTYRVRTYEHGVASVDNTAPHHPGNDSADEGDRKGVIDMEFELGFRIIMAVVRQDIQEGADEVE